ncbi:MAG: protein-(glutamine-N5) methyltransferase, release factor-specific [Candidatus Melainabacteria bacterium RIFCSPLOWO2_02_FULL_35_15]|nr:MAG: protein-(glutamine-N5) methyltransferase, release factor-specific [Candidatus Melainabacteria bacterium RIFCSPLOWO2_12_FULL_35_11]OGI13265.1 MAG: protein-(glutamine-N5) methyltransferase, release factor-specific [Candidatus Melainabacteria bacterium RIFCSPLOWO2_02_FULL_35_15]
MKNLINELIVAGIEENEAKKEISILESEIKDKEKIKLLVKERIKKRIPVQYILGKAYFMDFEVKVNKKVLIPRPETEILTEETIKKLQKYAQPEIVALDIGTGSGIIAIALAKLIPNIQITAIDIEKEIIDLACENARLNYVEDKIDFKICDIFSKCFEKLLQSRKFDLIISNPPYVKLNEMQKLKPEICLHEPKIALHGSKENKTGLIYYKRIVELVKKCCDIKLLAFEIDPLLVSDLKFLLRKNGFNNFEIIKDYAKLDRCLFVYI